MLPDPSDPKPLFTLSIADFIAITKVLVNDAVKEILSKKDSPTIEVSPEEEMDISGLAKFLHCSKVSIHKYKKKGMPYYRVGRKILFLKSEVLNFMKTIKSKKSSKSAGLKLSVLQ